MISTEGRRARARPAGSVVAGPSGLGTDGRIALAAIASVTVGQVVFLLVGCDWELCADEAEYWAWSRALDWSYFAKGPLIAALIRAGTTLFGGLSVAITGTLMPAVRLPALILGGLTAWGVFRLTEATCRNARAALWAVLVLPAVPIFRVGGLLMTIDTPLLCCWAWAAVWSLRAAEGVRRAGWVVAGLLGMAGVLAKYTMLAFPASVGAFLLLSKRHRRELIRPGFWVMSAFTGLGMVPIVAWNARHGWVGAGQMADRFGLTSAWNWGRVRPILDFLGCEVAVWGGVWWVVGVIALRHAAVAAVRRVRPVGLESPTGGRLVVHPDPGDRSGLVYLLCLWGVVWSACLAVCLLGETEANWDAPGYIAILALIGRWLDRGPLARRARLNLTGISLIAIWAVGMVGLTVVQHTEWVYPAIARLIPAATDRWPAPLKDLDPTNRMRGHRPLVPEIERRLAALRAEGLDPFLVAPTPYLASELSFYLPGHPTVYCLAFTPRPDRPANQHDLWHPNPRIDPGPFLGRPAVIVEDAHFRPSYAEALARLDWFGSAGAPDRYLVRERGQVVSAWDVSIARDFRGLAPDWPTRFPHARRVPR